MTVFLIFNLGLAMAHPLDTDMPSFGLLKLSDFRIWSDPALRSFLLLRNKPTTGPHDELAAR